MTVQTTFASNITAADARDTLNQVLADIRTLKASGSGGGSGAITLAISGAQSAEEGNAINFTVTRGGDLSVPVIVNYTTAGSGTYPVNAADHVGGAFPAGSVTIAANATSATIQVASAEDSVFEPDETGTVTISSSTANVTITNASAQYTFTNDDADPGSGSGGTVVYPATNTTDTGVVAVGGTNMRMECIYKNGSSAGSFMLGLDDDADGVALHQINDTTWQLRRVVAGDRGSDGAADDPKTLPGSNVTGLPVTDGQVLSVQIVNGIMTIFKNSTPITFASGPSYNVSAYVGGSNARYKGWIGAAISSLKMIRLA